MEKTSVLLLTLSSVITIFAAQAPNGEIYSDSPFFDDFEGSTINSSWLVATWKEHNGQTGPERCFVKDGLLHLQFVNSSTEGYLSSAIQTRAEFLYGKWEMKAKASNVPGVLNSFYTIDWDNTSNSSAENDGTKQEIDIEFLTKSFGNSSGEVHLALHNSKSSWYTNPDIPLWFDPSDNFHVYGFNITPNCIEWLADDSVIYRYEYEGKPISIDAPYMLKLNSWSDLKWIGGPPQADVVCDYQIDWIRFTPLQGNSIKKGRAEFKKIKGIPLKANNYSFSFYPCNPSPFQLRMFDAAGRLIVENQKLLLETGSYIFNSVGTSAGIILYQLETHSGTASGVFIKER